MASSQQQRTFYEVLDVSPQASENDIAKAYRRRALKAHPDRGGNEQEFKQIAEAYETLSDPAKRTAYDRGDHLHFHDRASSTARRHPFDDPFFHRSSFATSFGRDRPQASMAGGAHDPFSLFDRMFADFDAPHRGATSSTHASRGFSDPFGSGFGTFGANHGGPASSFLDSFFGTGSASFNGFPANAAAAAPSTPSSSSAGDGLRAGGVQSKQNPRGFTNCSFSTSFGSSTYSSSPRTQGQSKPTSTSTSTSTRIVNGVRQDVYEAVDARGNSTVHIQSSNGKQQTFYNGVEQASRPSALPSTHSSASSQLPSTASAGAGTRAQPFVVN